MLETLNKMQNLIKRKITKKLKVIVWLLRKFLDRLEKMEYFKRCWKNQGKIITKMFFFFMRRIQNSDFLNVKIEKKK